jgi:hypothetical protein
MQYSLSLKKPQKGAAKPSLQCSTAKRRMDTVGERHLQGMHLAHLRDLSMSSRSIKAMQQE